LKPDNLKAVLAANDVEGCIAFFADATEDQRRAMAKTAVARLRALTSGMPSRVVQVVIRLPDEYLREVRAKAKSDDVGLRVARIAVLATAALGELQKLGERGVPPILEDALAVFRARRPPWLRE
jgi:hypothetical protein